MVGGVDLGVGDVGGWWLIRLEWWEQSCIRIGSRPHVKCFVLSLQFALGFLRVEILAV